MKKFFTAIKNVFSDFIDDDPFTYSASIAFYTLFSLPAIVFLMIQIAGYFFGQEAVSNEVYAHINGIIGNEAAENTEDILVQAKREKDNIWATVLSVVTLIIGSTTVFGSIQNGLNQGWQVKPKPNATWKKMLKDRVFSFTIVVTLGFFMTVSLLMDTLLILLTNSIADSFPDSSIFLANTINFLVSVTVIVSLFTILLRLLPDVKISWKQALVGGSATTILFYLGKYLIAIYLQNSDFASAYGSAGSLVLLLVWVYYSSLIVLFGGKITQVYMVKTTGKITPSKLAMRYETKEIKIESDKK